MQTERARSLDGIAAGLLKHLPKGFKDRLMELGRDCVKACVPAFPSLKAKH